MTNIREKVARAIYASDYVETIDGPPDDLKTTGKTNQQNYADNAAAAITAFLEAAAEQGWHMRPDEPIGEMADYPTARVIWRAMLAAAPEFKQDGE